MKAFFELMKDKPRVCELFRYIMSETEEMRMEDVMTTMQAVMVAFVRRAGAMNTPANRESFARTNDETMREILRIGPSSEAGDAATNFCAEMARLQRKMVRLAESETRMPVPLWSDEAVEAFLETSDNTLRRLFQALQEAPVEMKPVTQRLQ